MTEKERPFIFWIGVILVQGFVTFWASVGLVLLGNPVNLYLTWYVLWSAWCLYLVWRLKRAEARRSPAQPKSESGV